ncbi:Lysophospholipase L1 [Salibacterium qingdaonense]|uniref:Lysophospholipase L1 n=2 Tax=Salibacterium qingdaonense TaxID=266892 RepID=A0A1I4LVH3_9BACI|nr:Lysophospholipase L1 [Salibacterium qingdaonense]
MRKNRYWKGASNHMLHYFKMFNKKSFVTMMVFTIGVLTGCSSKEEMMDLSAVEVGEKIKQDVNLDEMQEEDIEQLQNLYDIRAEEVESFILNLASTNVQADEVAVIKAKDAENVADMKEKIANRVQDKAKSFQDYLPAEYALIENYVLKTKGNFVFLAISEEVDQIERAFDEALNGNLPSTASNDSNDQDPNQQPNSSYQSTFSNSVFVGDSIIGGLTNDDLLDGIHVMGGLGATAEFTLEHVDEVVRRKPGYVFLSLGQNNIEEPVKESKENFENQYSKLVREIQEKLPNAKIYMLSITPVSSDVPEGNLSNKDIDDFNLALQDIAETEDVDYIDLSPIFENNDIRYAEDGSHFQNDFYPLLLDYLKEETDIETQFQKSRVIDSNDEYKQIFKNSVFMGDDIIGSLTYLDKLNEENVIAPSGATLDLLQLNVEQLVNQKPEHIFILIGSNDITIVDQEEFIEKYVKLINSIQEELPSAKINILSIPPVSDNALRKEPRYENIEAYNQSLQDLAATEKINYIDLSPIFKNNTIQYTKNGIHFKPDFYSLFLDYIKDDVG